MALPSRPAMRLLSSRLQSLQRSPRSNAFLGSIRASSRYSNPGARPATPAPSKEPSFIPDLTSAEEPISTPAGDFPGNLDYAAKRREFEAQKAYHLQRMRFAGIGLLLSVAGLAMTLYNLDLDEIESSGKKNKVLLDAPPESNATFQGRDIHVIGAGEDKRIIAEGQEETELVKTGSGSVPYFPRRIHLPAPEATATSPGTAPPTQEEEYTLVGLGIRTVTIFGIEVYVMGMYVRTSDISALQSRLIHLINSDASTLVPGEKDQLATRLLDPASSTEIWDTLLREEGVRSVWRVVPSKNTDFAHLRDGWMNGIKRATKEVKTHLKTGPTLTEYDDETFGTAVRSFRDIFTGGGRAPKGSVILLLRDAGGSLEILFQDPQKKQALESIGKVQDPRIGRLIWMAYLAGKDVSSESARKAVVDGYVAFAGRPLGSVETMVR